MGNQPSNEQHLSHYYHELLHAKAHPDSRTQSNQLKPTSKAHLDIKINRSSEKLAKKIVFDEPNVSNPLQKLTLKRHQHRSTTNLAFEDLLRNMAKHQDSSIESANRDQTTREHSRLEDHLKRKKLADLEFDPPCLKVSDQDTPLFHQEDRPLQFEFQSRERARTIESHAPSLKPIRLDRSFECDPARPLSKQISSLQFLLQNCTQAVSRTHVDPASANLTFDSLQSEFSQLISKKQSKTYVDANSTTQLSTLQNEKLYELSKSNLDSFHRSSVEEKQSLSRKTSCNESTFQIPVAQREQEPEQSLALREEARIAQWGEWRPQQKNNEIKQSKIQHPEEQWIQKSRSDLEYRKITLMLEENQENILDSCNLGDAEKRPRKTSLNGSLEDRFRALTIKKQLENIENTPYHNYNQQNAKSGPQNCIKLNIHARGTNSISNQQIPLFNHCNNQINPPQQKSPPLVIQQPEPALAPKLNRAETYHVQLNHLQKDFLTKISQPKLKLPPMPYWRIRESESSKRGAKKY